MWSTKPTTGTMAADEVTPVAEQVTPAPDATVDPRVEFAHQIVREAEKYGYRYEAIRVISNLLPGFQPEHVALARAKEYVDQLAPAGSVVHHNLVAAYLAGVDNR